MSSLGTLVVAPGWVAGEHIRAFNGNPHTHVAAIAAFRDSERKRAEEYQKAFGFECRVTDNYLDALKMEEVEIVTICSINSLHYEHTLAALKAKKHVLVEKPIALTLEQVSELCVLARQAEAATMVGHIVRYFPAIRSMHNLVEKGALGEVFHVETDYWHQLSAGWKTRKETAGGALEMGGIHAVDLMRYMMGEARKAEYVSALWSGPFHRMDYDYKPNVSALVRFEGGATGRVGVSVEAQMPYVFHLQVMGTKGTVREKGIYSTGLFPGVKEFVQLTEHYPDDGNVTRHPFDIEIADFVEAVRSGTPCQLDFRYAKATYELLFAIGRSAAEGTPVALRGGKGAFCMPY
ncbi:MAG TPA: Gfo/Idh/MocA family oxidoreductase [archaeon]|nr:Gfo/Idh/MocA family oxidoreductase [archaeon]